MARREHLPAPRSGRPSGFVPRHLEGWRPGLTAAGRRMESTDSGSYVAARRRDTWQTDAWDYFDVVGEVKYGVRYIASAMGRLRLFPAVAPDDPDGTPEQADGPAAAAIADLLDEMAGSDGTHYSLLAALSENLTVAGEGYIHGQDGPDGGTEWLVRSVEQVEVTGTGRSRMVKVYDTPTRDGQTGGRPVNEEDEFLSRLWLPHPRWPFLPDSPLRGVLSSCEELVLLEAATRAALRSRMGAGVWVLPDDLDYGPGDDTVDPGDGQLRESPLIDDLLRHFSAPLRDESDASALVPYLFTVPTDRVEQVVGGLVNPSRDIDDRIDTRTERALRRLAQGVNLPVEVLLGVGDVNHWSAWQISDDTWRAHLEPDAVMLVNSLTAGLITPWLAGLGIDPAGTFLWFDATRVTARPDREGAADTGLTAGAISPEAWRRVRGFTDEDAPADTGDPAVEAAMRMVEAAPSLMETVGLPGLVQQIRDAMAGDVAPVTVTPPTADDDGTGPPDDTRPTPGPVQGAGQPVPPSARSHLGGQLADIDRDLRARLHAASDVQMGRALGKAGARVRSRARKDKAASQAIDGVDDEHAPAVLGQRIVQSLGLEATDLVADAFDPLRDRATRWMADALDRAAKLAGVTVDDEARLRVGRAADWLTDQLTGLAVDVMWQAADGFEAPDVGEYDPTVRVPIGLIREAMARASGADAIVAALDGPEANATGLATGPAILDPLAAQGTVLDGWVWVYGPFPRGNGFEPHEQLDGVTFARFDDPRLANPDPSFPPTSHFYPGDHRGCVCDAVPLLFDREAAAAADAEAGVPPAATPSEGPNRGPRDGLWTDDVDPDLAERVRLRRHGGGGYTAEDGRWYVHREGDAWVVDEQLMDGGVLVAERRAVTPTLAGARTHIARGGRPPAPTPTGPASPLPPDFPKQRDLALRFRDRDVTGSPVRVDDIPDRVKFDLDETVVAHGADVGPTRAVVADGRLHMIERSVQLPDGVSLDDALDAIVDATVQAIPDGLEDAVRTVVYAAGRNPNDLLRSQQYGREFWSSASSNGPAIVFWNSSGRRGLDRMIRQATMDHEVGHSIMHVLNERLRAAGVASRQTINQVLRSDDRVAGWIKDAAEQHAYDLRTIELQDLQLLSRGPAKDEARRLFKAGDARPWDVIVADVQRRYDDDVAAFLESRQDIVADHAAATLTPGGRARPPEQWMTAATSDADRLERFAQSETRALAKARDRVKDGEVAINEAFDHDPDGRLIPTRTGRNTEALTVRSYIPDRTVYSDAPTLDGWVQFANQERRPGVTHYAGSVENGVEDWAESWMFWVQQQRTGRLGIDGYDSGALTFADLFPGRADTIARIFDVLGLDPTTVG